MVYLYKDVKNLILDFAGISMDDDNDDEVNYKCDICEEWRPDFVSYKRDFFFVSKKEFVSNDENIVNIFWRKKRFLRLHLCQACKLERGHNIEGISIKTSDIIPYGN